MSKTTKRHKAVAPMQIEAKAKWATLAAAAYAAIAAWVVANPRALDDYLPLWAQTLILFALGVGGVGGAAIQAPHTTRTDIHPAAGHPAGWADHVDPTGGLEGP